MFLMLLFTLVPSFGRLITHHEIRLVKGQNWVSFTLNLILFVSLVLLFFFTDFFRNIFKRTLNFNKVYNLLLLFGSILMLIVCRMLQGRKYSLFYWIKIYLNKEMTDEDIFEPKKVLNDNQSSIVNNYQSNFNTLLNIDNSRSETKIDNSSSKEYTSEINIDISKSETNFNNSTNEIYINSSPSETDADNSTIETNINNLIKALSPQEVLAIFEKHKLHIIIDNDNRKKILSLISYNEVKFPIVLEYSNTIGINNHKQNLVKFLKELFSLEDYWGKEISQERIIAYLNSMFQFNFKKKPTPLNRIDIVRNI